MCVHASENRLSPVIITYNPRGIVADSYVGEDVEEFVEKAFMLMVGLPSLPIAEQGVRVMERTNEVLL